MVAGDPQRQRPFGLRQLRRRAGRACPIASGRRSGAPRCADRGRRNGPRPEPVADDRRPPARRRPVSDPPRADPRAGLWPVPDCGWPSPGRTAARSGRVLDGPGPARRRSLDRRRPAARRRVARSGRNRAAPPRSGQRSAELAAASTRTPDRGWIWNRADNRPSAGPRRVGATRHCAIDRPAANRHGLAGSPGPLRPAIPATGGRDRGSAGRDRADSRGANRSRPGFRRAAIDRRSETLPAGFAGFPSRRRRHRRRRRGRRPTTMFPSVAPDAGGSRRPGVRPLFPTLFHGGDGKRATDRSGKAPSSLAGEGWSGRAERLRRAGNGVVPCATHLSLPANRGVTAVVVARGGE